MPRPRVRYDEPRGIAYDLIEELFTYMPDRGMPVKGGTVPDVSLTKLRLRVMAYTGRRKTAQRSTNSVQAQPSTARQ